MRLEAIEKEAELYGGERECYVHIEKVEGGVMNVISNGGETGLMMAGYVMVQNVAEALGKTPMEVLKFYKKMLKKIGAVEHCQTGDPYEA